VTSKSNPFVTLRALSFVLSGSPPHVRDLDLVALGDLVVVGLVREEERHDPEVDQVRGVDPLERLGDDARTPR